MGLVVIQLGGGWLSEKGYNQLGTRMWLKGLLPTPSPWELGSCSGWQHQWSAGDHVASPSL